ncbi:MAG TPA: protein translocase subunit SecD, partial [Dongiaceae bacterium]
MLIIGTLLAIPSMLPRAVVDALPGWLPKQTVNLGLDLQGGSHLLLEVGMDQLIDERLDGVVDEVRTKLRTAKIGYANLSKSNGAVTVTLTDPNSIDAARKELGVALNEGMEINADGPVLTLHYTDAGLTQLKSRTVEQSIEVVRRRIDEGG